MILLANEVIVFLALEAVLMALLTVAVVGTGTIIRNWDFSATTARQYGLEKRGYLVVLIILFTLVGKILLLPFFSLTLDRLAAIVPGAMCAAGVINANEYGFLLLGVKLAVLVLAGTWLILNRMDLQAPNYPYFRTKFWFFLVIYVVVAAESVLDVLYLTGISTLSPVQCCSIIYGVAVQGGGLPLGLNYPTLLLVFFLLYGLIIVLCLARFDLLNMLANLVFLFFGYLAVVYFFGTYIYQLPTHQCPFCMLQVEYFYVGYLVWGTFFLGVFFGVAGYALKLLTGKQVAFTRTWCMVFHSAFVILCSLYVGLYYLRNGVLL